MDRRSFIVKSSGAIGFGLLAGILASCAGSDGGSSAPPTSNCTNASVVAVTQGAHPSAPHMLELTQQQLTDGIAAGVDQTYTLSSASGHQHTVTLTNTELQMIRNKQSVTGLVSSQTGHTHPIDVLC